MSRAGLCALVLSLALLGCARPGGPAADGVVSDVRFGADTTRARVPRANRDLAEDFTDLTFGLETGETLTGLLRYETAIAVYLRSPGLAPYRPDIEALLARLRREARIDIRLTDSPDLANLFIEAVPRKALTRILPETSCVVIQGAPGWEQYRRSAGRPGARWSDQTRLTRAAIFIPLDQAPQDIRDCLHEEITQALGPANDLYRLPDSIWNDDNVVSAATAFDLLMLRVLYDPALASGLSEPRARAAARAVLDRVNPDGRAPPPRPRAPEHPEWNAAIEAARSADTPRRARRAAAARAVDLAAAMSPPDHRLEISLTALASAELPRDPEAAALHFAQAYGLSADRFGGDDLRTAHIGIHLAAFALATGAPDLALALAERHILAAVAGRNAILLAQYHSVRAAALAERGQDAAAGEARLDSLRWARYGFGDAVPPPATARLNE